MLVVGPDTMIYWTDVAASHRQSTLRTAEEEEDICGCLYVYYSSRLSERELVGGPGRCLCPAHPWLEEIQKFYFRPVGSHQQL